MATDKAEEEAIRLLCSKYFHQRLWLPATDEYPKLRVTFSTTTNFDNVALPPILFIGPMFGSRYMSLHFDKLARDCGVRAICVDRPALGGSTPVDLAIRMQVWLETVPALLEHLKVEHVSIMTHSAGTIYTLNTLFYQRAILDPTAPYVAFMAPFVPQKNSGATLPTLASKLPTGILDSWAGVNSFIVNNILPSASWSGGLVSSSAAFFSSAKVDAPEAEISTDMTEVEQYGYNEETAKIISKLSLKYQFAETNQGGNDEAKLCLSKCDDAAWGQAADYEACIKKIAQHEARRHPGRGTTRLMIDAFFAESDIMSGNRGQQFFEDCWQRDEVKKQVDFTTVTLPGTSHDSVLAEQKKGALRLVFEKIAKLHAEAPT